VTDLTSGAADVSRRLCDAAIWHRGACTWMTAGPFDGGPGVELSPAGPDVYDGTAGIALFLAEFATAAGDPAAARTARGAARHSLDHVERIEAEARLGFHAGLPGAGVALVRVGRLLGADDLVEGGLRMATRVVEGGWRARWPGLISGQAGGVVALLTLSELCGDPGPALLARRLGEDLVARAQEGGGGLHWTYATESDAAGLTGLGLGAAGIGWALLELWSATGDSAFRAAAQGAFAYERGLFDPEERNWRDLRERRGPSFHCTWCHGAPGIALALARAHELLGDEALGDEAEIGLATTERLTRAMLASEHFNYSLCHGLGGNALVMLEAESLLGDGLSGSRLAMQVAEVGVDRHTGSGRAWPCGTFVGEVPGLMTGLAGIGMFLLHAAGWGVPSVLLPRPASAGARRGAET
jgi:class II lanthipeptide synthase